MEEIIKIFNNHINLINLIDDYLKQTQGVFHEYYVHYTDRNKNNKISASIFESRMYKIGKEKGFDSTEYNKIREYSLCRENSEIPIPKYGSLNNIDPALNISEISHTFIDYENKGDLFGKIKLLNTKNGIKVKDNINDYILYPVIYNNRFFRFELIDLSFLKKLQNV